MVTLISVLLLLVTGGFFLLGKRTRDRIKDRLARPQPREPGRVRSGHALVEEAVEQELVGPGERGAAGGAEQTAEGIRRPQQAIR